MSHFYKNVKENQLRVGLFVVAVLLISILSYNWLMDWFSLNRYNMVQVLFDSISNLEKGNSVFYRGVRVGRVSALNFTPDGILLDLLIEKHVKIGKDADFLIKDKDMLGTKTLEIVPGNSSEHITPGVVQIGRSVPGFSDLILNINNLSEKIETLVNQFEGEEAIFERIGDIISNVDVSLSSMQILLSDLKNSDMLESFTELRKASVNIQELINENAESLAVTLELTNHAFTKIDTLLVSSTQLINQINKQMSNQNSNINKLMTDEELYKNLVKSIKEMELLISDIKENPKRYFKFSVF